MGMISIFIFPFPCKLSMKTFLVTLEGEPAAGDVLGSHLQVFLWGYCQSYHLFMFHCLPFLFSACGGTVRLLGSRTFIYGARASATTSSVLFFNGT